MPRVQQKRGTAANLASVNPTPLAGELVWDSTENAIKIGDGATAWTSLAYVTATPRTHNHDDRYYTESEVDGLLGGKVGTDDSRLADARVPTAHAHPLSDLEQSGATSGQVVTWDGTAWVAQTPSGGSGTALTAYGAKLTFG